MKQDAQSKQEETVEQAAERRYPIDDTYLYDGEEKQHLKRQAFYQGASWKEQQLKGKMFTREDIFQMYKETCERLTNSFLSYDIEWFNKNFPE